MTFCLFVWTISVPLGHMTLKYTVIGSRAFAACACCYTAAFGGHLFYDLFSQSWGGHGPLTPPGSATVLTLVEPRWTLGMCPTPPVQFLSFSCSFRQESCRIIGFCPKFRNCHSSVWEILDPPLELHEIN